MQLLFDLDGTLTDPERGITACIAHALERMGMPTPPRAELRRYIGPPLRDGFAMLLDADDADLVERAVRLYRERFSTIGLYENELYTEVPATLARLRAAGHRLYVATSKPAVYAARIVEHFELRPLFDGIYGPELTGERSDKTELLAHLLAAERIAAVDAVMIGDRHHDITGARGNGVTSVGVLWGYGSADELHDADHIVDSWPALVRCIEALQAGDGRP